MYDDGSECRYRNRVEFKGLELFNDSVCILRIIFGNESFNTGRIKDGHISFSRINSLADRFSNINKVIENELQII